MNILITGCAGFIGFHLSKSFNSKYKIFGIDNLNNYNKDIKIKFDRLKILKKKKNFIFLKKDLNNRKFLNNLFKKYKFKYVIHLAAKPGVRESFLKPDLYFKNNVNNFYNLINLSAKNNIKHFIYASSSSVYGDTKKPPFKESDNTDNPVSFYAATKKINEIIASSFSKTHKLNTTGLRFFSVYGPYGRKDMAYFKFVNLIVNNKKINLFNHGNHARDFTYIDDVIKIIKKIVFKKQKKPFYRILNIGNSKKVKLTYFLKCIEKILKKKAKVINIEKQIGDINETLASNNKVVKLTKIKISTNIEDGLKKFIYWYKKYYNKS